MSKMPEEWVECTFGDLFKSLTNGIGGKQNKEGLGIPVSRIETISHEDIDLNRIGYISEYDNEKKDKYKLESGDILFSHINSPIHLGKTAIISDEYLYHGINLLKITLCENSCKPALFNHYCKFTRTKGDFSLKAQHAVNQSSLNQKKLKSFIFNLPPKKEQDEIETRLELLLGQVDKIKTRLDGIPAILKSFRQSVLSAAVTGKLTEDWRGLNKDVIPIDKTLEEVESHRKGLLKVRSKKGMDDALQLENLPVNWAWVKAHRLAEDSNNSICAGPFGTIFKAKDFRDEGVPIIFIRHVKEDGFNQRKPNFMDVKVWEEFHQEYSVYGGELLITKLGDPPGESCIYPKDQGTAMVTPDILKMSVDSKVCFTKYLMYFFNSMNSKKIIRELAFGATRLRIDIAMFKNFPIPTPPLVEQEEILKRVESYFKLADSIESKVKEAQSRVDNLTQSILAKAFCGDLTKEWRELNKDLITGDNSAFSLLEKIKDEQEKLKPKK